MKWPLGSLYSAIGSAVSTAVNGGSWKSFAIGVGIGIAAAGIASAVGGWLSQGSQNWADALAKSGLPGLGAKALNAVIMGSTSGAISSAIYGGNVGKGMVNGMQAAAIGMSVGLGANIARPLAEIVTKATIETIQWVATKAVETVMFVAQKTLEVISFVATKTFDATLSVAGEVWNSPCFDAGDSNDPNDYIGETDIDSNPRFIWDKVDIGADELVIVAYNITKDTAHISIQQSIDKASTGDEIEVVEGVHFENIDFKGKNITLRSIEPNNWDVVAATIIKGNGAAETEWVVKFGPGNTNNTIFSGFTICNGRGGMLNLYGSPTITSCVVVDNWGIAIGSPMGGAPKIRNNKVLRNGSRISLGYSGAAVIENNWICDSDSIDGTGIDIDEPDSSIFIRNNTIVNNDFGILFANIEELCPDPNIINCII